MTDKQKIDNKTMDILKKNMIDNVFSLMTQEQRKECFEFIAKYYNLKTGAKVNE
ncbi:hypothetical protein KAX02_05430 [candidate division WOR-3 bacterium]|nr:hypothetical protein [candidate division WOR-3 bacterium]